MFGRLVLPEDERAVDNSLGYPRGYAKLCRNAALQLPGLLSPFTEGPPQRFLPYASHPDEADKLKELDGLFPIVAVAERDTSNAHKHADVLWEQLDHLGNAGFDPAKFRVDSFGNVLYYDADPSSPLFWDVDHWFPHSRGGKTLLSNLRIIQWQSKQRKKERLEFLVPWWDLQLGVSVNQFLSAFASKNVGFRRRSCSFFFTLEDEQIVRQHVDNCLPWPQNFRERKRLCGLAAAAIVRVPRDNDDPLRISNYSRTLGVSSEGPAVSGQGARRKWSPEEEEALRCAVQKFGPGNWKEIKEYEPILVTRSTMQIKDKYRLMKGEWHLDKENRVTTPHSGDMGDVEKQALVSAALNKEMKVKSARDEERREREEEMQQLEATLSNFKKQNELDRVALEELERTLVQHRKKVEKQRRWSETQSSYRLCLERMIRDTMHQSISYKEQARLNQAACNALMARLECEKVTCEAAEKDLIVKFSTKETFSALTRNVTENVKKRPLKGRDLVDVSSCLSHQQAALEDSVASGHTIYPSTYTSENDYHCRDERGSENEDEDMSLQNVRMKQRKLRETCFYLDRSINLSSRDHRRFEQVMEGSCSWKSVQPGLGRIWADTAEVSAEAKELFPLEKPADNVARSRVAVWEETEDKGHCNDADDEGEGKERADIVVAGQAKNEKESDECNIFEEQILSQKYPPILPDANLDQKNVILEKAILPAEEDSQLDDMLEEALKATETEDRQQVSDEEEDDDVKRVGKSNLDKWLHALLHENPVPGLLPDVSSLTETSKELRDDGELVEKKGGEEKPKGIWGGLLMKLSFKQQQPDQKTVRNSQELLGGEGKADPLDKILRTIGAMTLNSGRQSVDGALKEVEADDCLQIDCDSEHSPSFRAAGRNGSLEPSVSLERYASICREEQEFGTFDFDGQGSSDYETLSTAGSESRRDSGRSNQEDLQQQQQQQPKSRLRVSLKSVLKKAVKKIQEGGT